nr:dehL [Rhizobium sp.]
MSLKKRIKALTFDTGGTVARLAVPASEMLLRRQAAGTESIETGRYWPMNCRRRSMQAMLNLGREPPRHTTLMVRHQFSLDAILAEEGLDVFDDEDRAHCWDAPHSFDPGDVRDGLARLRDRYIAVSFTFVSHRLIIDTTSVVTGLMWMRSCLVREWVSTSHCQQICESGGYASRKALRNALWSHAIVSILMQRETSASGQPLINRPDEWGKAIGPQKPPPGSEPYDIELNSFLELAAFLESESSLKANAISGAVRGSAARPTAPGRYALVALYASAEGK